MAITVGTDTYVTVAEADTYIAEHYMSTDFQRIEWETLDDVNKEIVLRNATPSIGNIKLNGRKKDSDQVLSFPRCYKNAYYLPISWYETKDIDGYSMHCEVDVPDNIKYAQVAEAIELCKATKDSSDYMALNGAVKSYSITGLSETYKDIPNGASGTPSTELRSKKAQKLLQDYVGGGYHVT